MRGFQNSPNRTNPNNMDAFFRAIEPLMSLSPVGRQALAGIMEPVAFPKGHVLIRQDTICRRIYFIETGLARTYYYKDGRDVTDWLAAEGDLVGSMVSFLTQQPDRRIVELLEPSRLWAIPRPELEGLYARHHEIERLGRLLVGSGLIQMQQRFDDLHFASAAERYQTLLSRNASFVQRVPLGMIASYLGISQETLSRIRARV